MYTLKGKIIFKSDLELVTGLHIGTSGSFSAIGTVDAFVIRDPYTKIPIIPGSSLKGKMRYLLYKILNNSVEDRADIEEEGYMVKRLFGGSNPVIESRIKFQDIKLKDESIEDLKKLDLDLPFAEIKFENTINRTTGVAMPRQLERVPAGAKFNFKMTYDIEKESELEEDLKNINMMMELLEEDYLGGHGTRGYGRVKFNNKKVELKSYADLQITKEEIEEILSV
jgi:CRISPR-associated protein Csm3